MHLVVVGLNHHSAPIEVRERLTFPENRLSEALRALRARPGIAEAAILSTCNRTELYGSIHRLADASLLTGFLAESHNLPEQRFAHHLYNHADAAAVEHLLRVASGLDSLVLGEPQILGQVRDAFAVGTESGSIGSILNALFRAAITCGKRARTETGIGHGGFSIGHAAVDLARSIFGSLNGATILILGAGKMSELTAKHLVAQGTKCVFVANRTYEKAVSLASRLGGSAIQYDAFPEALIVADVVVSSTASPVPIVKRETLVPILRRRRGRPLFLIDIAVPRDIAADVATLENVFLYDLDDLEEVVADMTRERSAEAVRVEAIIADEAARFLAWRRALDAAPVVAQLREKYEQMRQAELVRLRNQLPDLSERAWQCIEAATRSLTNSFTRDPIAALKSAVTQEAAPADYDLLGAARAILGLKEGDAETLATPSSGHGSPTTLGESLDSSQEQKRGEAVERTDTEAAPRFLGESPGVGVGTGGEESAL